MQFFLKGKNIIYEPIYKKPMKPKMQINSTNQSHLCKNGIGIYMFVSRGSDKQEVNVRGWGVRGWGESRKRRLGVIFLQELPI